MSKNRDCCAEREANRAAIKQEVSFTDFIATLKTLKPAKTADLERLLEKYTSGTLPVTGAYTVVKMSVGLDSCKEAFEKLAPGYSRDWACDTHEIPPLV